MCDERIVEDWNRHFERAGNLTRRQFGALSVGTGMAFLLPRAVGAVDVTGADIEVSTPDGTCDCHFVHPTSGSHPGVLIWPDALGLRPAFKQMGQRLAESGYSVLVVNQYYRERRAPVAQPGEHFGQEDTQKRIRALMATLNPQTHVTDARAFVTFLDGQGSVDPNRKMGTMGYCMGGPITMRTAAAVSDRIGAGASFHGGGLVTDQPDSPHLLVPTHEGALPVRHRRERRREPAGSEGRAARDVCRGEPAGRDRGVRRRAARLVSAGFAGVQRAAGGAGLEPAARPVRERTVLTGGVTP